MSDPTFEIPLGACVAEQEFGTTIDVREHPEYAHGHVRREALIHLAVAENFGAASVAGGTLDRTGSGRTVRVGL